MSIHSEPLSLFQHKLSFSFQSGKIWSHSGLHFFGSHFWLTFSFFNFVFTFCFEMLTTVYRSATFWCSALAFAVVLRFSNRGPIHFTFASMCQPPFPLREGSCYQIGWIFGKVPKGGGTFNPKIYIADFGNFSLLYFYFSFWAWNW